MGGTREYLRQHHVALLALVVALAGGTAYAAEKLPKNSVVSATVKNNALKGKDLKDGTVAGKDVQDGGLGGADLGDGSVTGADLGDGSVTGADLGDGSVTGADLADGSVGAADLAADAVRETELLVVPAAQGAGPVTVFSDPAIGTISLSCNASLDVTLLATLPSTATPGSVKVAGTDLADDSPVGAVTIVQTTPAGSGGVASYGGSGTAIPQGIAFFDTATKRLMLHWDITPFNPCALRGELEIVDKPGTARPAPASAVVAPPAVCSQHGDAWCEVDPVR